MSSHPNDMVPLRAGSTLPSEILGGGLPFKEFLGLPVHPLVVHGAVVLLPLAAIGVFAMATDIKRSKKYGFLVTVLAAVAGVFSLLAVASGRDLAVSLGSGQQQHFELGELLPWFALALFGAALLLWLIDKKPTKRGLPGKILALVAIVVGVATIGWTLYTGHLGAELTWGLR